MRSAAAAPSSTWPRSTGSGPGIPTPSTPSTSKARATCSAPPTRRASSGSCTRARWAPSGSSTSRARTRPTSAPSPMSGISTARTSGPSTWPSTRCCVPSPRGCRPPSCCRRSPSAPGIRAPTPTGKLVLDFLNGRMPAYVDTVLNVAHVDDVAAGQVLALEHGRTGRSYILGRGEPDPAGVAVRARGHHGAPGPVRQGAQSAGPGCGRRLRAGRGPAAAPAPVGAAGGGADVDLPDVLRHQPGPGGVGLCAPARRRGARGLRPLVRRNGPGTREQAGTGSVGRRATDAPDGAATRPASGTLVAVAPQFIYTMRGLTASIRPTVRSSGASTSPSTREPRSGSSAPTGRASRRCCGSWRARTTGSPAKPG